MNNKNDDMAKNWEKQSEKYNQYVYGRFCFMLHWIFYFFALTM